MEVTLLDAQIKIQNNDKYSAKLSYKRAESLQLSTAIKDFLLDKGMSLPPSYYDYRGREERILVDRETGECFFDYDELARLHYKLKMRCDGVYNLYGEGKDAKSQVEFSYYEKHKMNPVWNWRKSKLIRKMWRKFLIESRIYKDYKPMHLVLTVPHKSGVWQGKRFYGKELVAKFNLLRKNPLWKNYIYGGEYGIEIIKVVKDNGLHIHIHALVFQYPKYPVNQVRDFIKSGWQQLSGATSIHYESLYINRKNESGEYITELIPPKVIITDSEEVEIQEAKTVRKKFYLENKYEWFRQLPDEQKLESYVSGVMECIKYHFKQDSLKMANGEYDIDLVNEILLNSKNFRMYSKFGAFHNEKRLNLSQIEKPIAGQSDQQIEDQAREEQSESLGEESESDEDEKLNGDVQLIERINPHTHLPASEGEYRRCIAAPEYIKHLPKHEKYPYQPQVGKSDVFYELKPGLETAQLVRALAKRRYQDILAFEEYARFTGRKSTCNNST